MRIAVDAMGGDYAPEAPVEGTLLAGPQCSAELVLIGNESRIGNILAHVENASSISVVHASEMIHMEEAGSMAIRKKRDASLSVALRLLAEGRVDAVVSAGNSSAIVAAARHFVGLISGVRRPAMAVPLPIPGKHTLLLDAGAHAEANTIHLAQAAALAHVYLRVVSRLDRPRIGLINIGREQLKGPKVIQRVFALLRRSRLHFVGNIEPHDLFRDQTDAVISDGFVGNVVLKLYEGLMENFLRLIESQLNGSGTPEIRGEIQNSFSRLRETCNYQNIGGAPLLGVRKPVVVAHGRSQAQAMANAIHQAFHLVNDRVYERMSDELEADGILSELKHQNALLMLENITSMWGFSQKNPE